jgi:O-antigen/teichoic acid export membrane protein
MQFLKSISIYTGIGVFTGGISFLLLPVLTKYLSPEDYGILALFTGIVSFFSVLIPIGMGYVLNVYVIEKADLYPLYLKSFIKTTFFLCIIITALVYIITLFYSSIFGLPYYVLLALPLFSLLVVYFDTSVSYFIYNRNIKNYSFFFISKFLLEIIFIILLVVIFPFSWKGRIVALLISLIFINLVSGYYFWRKGIISSKKINKNLTNELFKKGFPLVFMGISVMVINLSDRFFIENLVGLSETGIYNIASTIAGILLLVIGASINVVRPNIFNLLKERKEKIVLLKVFVNYSLVLAITSILLYLATPLIFKYLINDRYIAAIELVHLLIIGIFFWGLYNFFVSILMYFELNKIIGVISLVGVAVNLTLNYFLINNYKLIGAAYATLLTYAFIFFVTIIMLFINYKSKYNVA